MRRRPEAADYDLATSSRAVFSALASIGPATRPQLGEALALSKPTMSAAIAELADHGLVTHQGAVRGTTGRAAQLYSIAPSAGHVLGVEAGSTRIRVSAHALDGHQIATAERRLSSRARRVTEAVVSAVASAGEEVRAATGEASGPLRQVVIAAPTLPSEGRAKELRPDGLDMLDKALPLPPEVPVSIENNVNCAAMAEHRVGAARGHDDFVYLQVGVKIGLGVVIGGQLMRGFHGAAGEIAMLPFPWAPGGPAPHRAGLEEFIGSTALMARCSADWPAGRGAPPRTPEALFEAAAGGNEVARKMVDAHAQDIGRVVTAVLGVVDPGLVVLGGGVGQNQLLLPEVRRVIEELAWPVDVMIGALGDHATIQGAVHTAITRALDRMI
jgi:predicted NBD/HSP70 family sugar kinase